MMTNCAIQESFNIKSATNRFKKILDAKYKKGKFKRNNNKN